MCVEIEFGENCPRCGFEFGIRCVEFNSCYNCNYPYEKEEKVIQEQLEKDSDDDLPF